MTSVVTFKREAYPSGQSWAIEDVLWQTENRIRSAHATHLGYPYNLVSYSPVPASLGDYLVNNLGDPYVGSHYASHTCDLEREAVAWLMDLWQCDDHDRFWGSVGASGTEGNIWAMYLAREAFPNAKLLYSREAHYSIPKAARILRMEFDRGRLRDGRCHRHRSVRQSARCTRRRSRHRGADLRHHGEGSA